MAQIWKKLTAHLRDLAGTDRLVVGLSGGVDSTLLVRAASQAGGERLLAVVADTPFMNREAVRRATALADEMNVAHEVLSVDLMSDPAIRHNHQDRCYRCKYMLFSSVQSAFDGVVLDGSNSDDDPARPGLKALRELGVCSPLRELGIGKQDIRTLAREQGLCNADLPSDSCLATRYDFGARLTTERLEAVECIEAKLRELGLADVRARVGDLKVIVEIPRGCGKILEQNHQAIVETIKGVGLGLAGYGYRRTEG